MFHPQTLVRPRALDRRAAIVAIAALTAALGGCKHGYSGDGASPESSSLAGRLAGPTVPGIDGAVRGGRGAFYPLAVGNRWDYSIHTRTTIVTEAGPQAPIDTERSWAAEIVGTVALGGRQYFVQSEFDPRANPPTVGIGFPMREDRSGLFETDARPAPGGLTGGGNRPDPLAAELAVTVDRAFAGDGRPEAFRRAIDEISAKLGAIRLAAFASGPTRGGPDPGEIALLRYPLFVGARWDVRESPRFTRIVEGREFLRVPAGTFKAWRLRGTAELFGPEDRVTFWYSPAGLLRIRFHVIGEAVDDQGNLSGHVITDSDQVLTDLHLADAGLPQGVASGQE